MDEAEKKLRDDASFEKQVLARQLADERSRREARTRKRVYPFEQRKLAQPLPTEQRAQMVGAPRRRLDLSQALRRLGSRRALGLSVMVSRN